MSALPKALLALLLLVLPGGFLVAPLVLLWLRWHSRPAASGPAAQSAPAHSAT